MHRLFLVHELLVIICEHLYDEDDIPNASKEALARLARTCKAFHAVALNALWSNLDGVAPLIQCLPAEVTRLYWRLVCRLLFTAVFNPSSTYHLLSL